MGGGLDEDDDLDDKSCDFGIITHHDSSLSNQNGISDTQRNF